MFAFLAIAAIAGVPASETADAVVSQTVFQASLGVNWATNNPFLKRNGGRLSLEYSRDVFGIEIALAGYPDLGTADWKPLTKELAYEFMVQPEFSREIARANLLTHFYPITLTTQVFPARFGVHFGPGVVHTTEDRCALQSCIMWYDDASTAVENHITMAAGITLAVPSRGWGIRWRIEREWYVETWLGSELELTSREWMGLEFFFFKQLRPT